MRQRDLAKKIIASSLIAAAAVALLAWWATTSQAGERRPQRPGPRPHLDHAPFFNAPFARGEDVTKACLRCHEAEAREMRHTPHWEWLGDEEQIPETQRRLRLGKRNVVNNFCISIQGNWAACTKCHAGYGWRDQNFDFDDLSRMDCLVCHEHSGTYAKTFAGEPRKDVDLLAVARSVGSPTRATCSSCHTYGGGGLAVKHGDLDSTPRANVV